VTTTTEALTTTVAPTTTTSTTTELPIDLPPTISDGADEDACDGVEPEISGHQFIPLAGSGVPILPASPLLTNDTAFSVPAEDGVSFTFIAIPAVCVETLQMDILDEDGEVIEYPSGRSPFNVEQVSPFSAFGDMMTTFAPFSVTDEGPGTFTLVSVPTNGDLLGEPVLLSFDVPSSEESDRRSEDGTRPGAGSFLD